MDWRECFIVVPNDQLRHSRRKRSWLAMMRFEFFIIYLLRGVAAVACSGWFADLPITQNLKSALPGSVRGQVYPGC